LKISRGRLQRTAIVNDANCKAHPQRANKKTNGINEKGEAEKLKIPENPTGEKTRMSSELQGYIAGVGLYIVVGRFTNYSAT
jgi:hypothetical protein